MRRVVGTTAMILVLAIGSTDLAAAKRVDREFHETFDVSAGARLDTGNVTLRLAG